MKWWIWVHGYGAFEFEGSEAEAEEMRAHKARWEHGIARKWQIADDRKIIPRNARDALPPANNLNGVQYEILATEAALSVLEEPDLSPLDMAVLVESKQAYRGLSHEWWGRFWQGWYDDAVSCDGNVAYETGALANEIYNAYADKH